MSMATFLLRLIGRDPDQLQAKDDFEKNLKKLDEADKELDELVKTLESVDRSVKRKDRARDAVISTMPPPLEFLEALAMENEDYDPPAARKPFPSTP